MNAQRCWFLELLARRPAWRMRSRCSSSSGRSAKRRTTRWDVTASQTDVGGHQPSPGSSADASASRSGIRVAPGKATWASVRKPPGIVSTADRRSSAAGMRSRGRGRGDRGRLVGIERAVQRSGQEPRDTSPICGILVQPRMLPARDDHGLDRLGRRIRRARATGGRREPGHVGERHDLVLVAVREEDRPSIPGDRIGRADLGHDVATRPEEHAGRQPGQRISDRVGDRQACQPGTSDASAGMDRLVRRSRPRRRRAGRRRPQGSRRSPPSSARPARRTSPRGVRRSLGTRPGRRARTRRH